MFIAKTYMTCEYPYPFPSSKPMIFETLTNKFQTIFAVKACLHFIAAYTQRGFLRTFEILCFHLISLFSGPRFCRNHTMISLAKEQEDP